jgi:POT family proton-dependent oligopeptide transporter
MAEGHQTEGSFPPELRERLDSPPSPRLEQRLLQARKEDAEAQRPGRSGHPRGLYTLFGLELWERFSFLGFQAILALYLADSVATGGLGYEEGVASSVVAAYGAMVYLVAIGGAWVADRIAGTYRSVLWGAIVIAAGHIFMGIPAAFSTWVGLSLIIVGTGLLKPNVATMVGELYPKESERRDAGFSIYYAGINVGAFLGPIIAGFLGQNVQWHAGFLAAAVGMILGLVQYVLGARRLGGRVQNRITQANFRADAAFWWTVVIVLAAIGVGLLFALLQDEPIGALVNGITFISAVVPVVFLVWMYRSKKVTPKERRNLVPFMLLLIALVMYNLTYFQTGNTLNFLALNHTQNSALGFDYPSTWYISLTAIVEIIAGPILAWLWVKMGSRQPHVSVKVGLGAVLGGCAFLAIALAALITPAGALLAAGWLVVCYILLGLGDLVLQTSGMSATTKLAPHAFKSQTMAMWFAAMALAQGIQAQIVKLFDFGSAASYFGIQGIVVAGYGVLLIALSPWIARRMHSID